MIFRHRQTGITAIAQRRRSTPDIWRELWRKNGFEPYFGEWWHFSDTDTYAVEEEVMPPSDCEE